MKGCLEKKSYRSGSIWEPADWHPEQKKYYDFLRLELEKRNIDAAVISTGDMGYSFAEPTIEVTLPGEDPVVLAMSISSKLMR